MPNNFFQEKESETLDYKLTWHLDRAELLRDILSLANADSKHPRRLVFGVADDLKNFPGVGKDPNRLNQAELVDWLRKMKLNHIPKVNLETICDANAEFDIINIENTLEKPYYLEELYRNGKTTLYPGAIYTRDKDTNTPKDRCARQPQIEKMYKERFGILNNRNKLIKTAIEDAHYNETPGIGNFRLDGQHELLSSVSECELSQDIINLLRECVKLEGVCNGRPVPGYATPSIVKIKNKQLREALENFLASNAP